MNTIASVNIRMLYVLGDRVWRVPPVLKWSQLSLHYGPAEVHDLLKVSLPGLVTRCDLIDEALALVLVVTSWWAAAEGILELAHTILDQSRTSKHLCELPFLLGDFFHFFRFIGKRECGGQWRRSLSHCDFNSLFGFGYHWLMLLIKLAQIKFCLPSSWRRRLEQIVCLVTRRRHNFSELASGWNCFLKVIIEDGIYDDLLAMILVN